MSFPGRQLIGDERRMFTRDLSGIDHSCARNRDWQFLTQRRRSPRVCSVEGVESLSDPTFRHSSSSSGTAEEHKECDQLQTILLARDLHWDACWAQRGGGSNDPTWSGLIYLWPNPAQTRHEDGYWTVAVQGCQFEYKLVRRVQGQGVLNVTVVE